MLNKRLRAISEMVLKGHPAADIGTDHAALSLYLIENGIVPRAIASELNEGPFKRAAKIVQNSPWGDKVELRKGNGLEVLKTAEVSTVIIAGMGGDTIVDILASDWTKAGSFGFYLFQPMSKPEVLRKELSLRGWPIVAEQVVQEKSRYYVVIASCPGSSPYTLSGLERDVGPIILKNPAPINRTFLKYRLKKYYAVSEGLSHTYRQEEIILVEEYKKRIKELEDILYGSQG
ncbi:MAG: class I SAM-dependent methyltransferase [Syntrophomonas sp.]